ncbi:hypothetical protein TNCV_3573511 [Trichonephila clavipes]|nr:hypothetical protein TNCV_3573511 [Trichonephila clavipes]
MIVLTVTLLEIPYILEEFRYPLGSSSTEGKDKRCGIGKYSPLSLSAYCPDLNPIEYAWDALGRRIAQRTNSPDIVQELKKAMREKSG